MLNRHLEDPQEYNGKWVPLPILLKKVKTLQKPGYEIETLMNCLLSQEVEFATVVQKMTMILKINASAFIGKNAYVERPPRFACKVFKSLERFLLGSFILIPNFICWRVRLE